LLKNQHVYNIIEGFVIMITINDLKSLEGKELKIAGQTFTMSLSSDSDGGFATHVVWISKDYEIHATPVYEIDGILINISDIIDLNEEPIDVENYYGAVPDVQTYFDIVAKNANIMFNRNPLNTHKENTFALALLAQKRKESDHPNDAFHDLVEAAWKYFNENGYDDPMEFGEMIGSELNDVCLALTEKKIKENHELLKYR
jgi:hypothetical protein